MRRPHWLPETVWMGIKIGEWPITVFSTQEQAQRWAAATGYGDRERVYWAVSIPEDTVIYASEEIPATTRAKRVYP